MGAEEHSREVKVTNAYGIHARPAALIVKEAAQYNAEITLEKEGNVVSCKSIMGLMTIEGFPGSVLTLSATGTDAIAALDAIESLFLNQFNEE